MYTFCFLSFIFIVFFLNILIILQSNKVVEIHDYYKIKNNSIFYSFNIFKNSLTNRLISILSISFFIFDLILCNLMINKT
ncbi:hypothetical protein RJD23_01290 [Buchnera aphidicola (Ceratoglyphina bambusae)]|uniref:hypothetical protein n=1 Tax=Buchnera aphidicola TaxID=9 RepID=UPI0031B80444